MLIRSFTDALNIAQCHNITLPGPRSGLLCRRPTTIGHGHDSQQQQLLLLQLVPREQLHMRQLLHVRRLRRIDLHQHLSGRLSVGVDLVRTIRIKPVCCSCSSQLPTHHAPLPWQQFLGNVTSANYRKLTWTVLSLHSNNLVWDYDD